MNISDKNIHPNSSILFHFLKKIFDQLYMLPKPLAINHRACTSYHSLVSNEHFLGKIILKYTTKRSKIHLFHDFFSMEHFPKHPQKRVCNEIFTTKETCPFPHLKFCILFYMIYMKGGGGEGADFTCLSVCVSKSCQKS